jgi:hypothetical protein
MSGRPRRWHRVVIPFAVVSLLFTVTGISYAWEEPNLDEAGTLSPGGTGPDGSSRLAARLAARGVAVERHTRSADAARAAAGGRATVFVPVPAYPQPGFVRILAGLPTGVRVVLVEPGPLDQSGLPVGYGPRRWAPRTPDPGCGQPVPAAAGRATVLRRPYRIRAGADGYSCYAGGLVGLRWRTLDLVVVGATDPFRNSRIDEYGNSALAIGLLAAEPRVIWLDLHAPERSRVPPDIGGGEPPDEQAPGSSGENPLWTAVPPMLWPVLTQLGLVAVLLGLWRARRLGGPVVEPLPVAVPAAETVTGRGRLYQRAQARAPALEVLRAAARHHLQRRLDLPAPASETDLVAAVSARARRPAGEVHEILYGGGVDLPDDSHLLAAVAALDALVHAASTERPNDSTVQGGQFR